MLFHGFHPPNEDEERLEDDPTELVLDIELAELLLELVELTEFAEEDDSEELRDDVLLEDMLLRELLELRELHDELMSDDEDRREEELFHQPP